MNPFFKNLIPGFIIGVWIGWAVGMLILHLLPH